jgi:hypothetical protein
MIDSMAEAIDHNSSDQQRHEKVEVRRHRGAKPVRHGNFNSDCRTAHDLRQS